MTQKTHTMLKRLRHLIDRDREDKKVKRSHLREVLSDLRLRQRKLERKLAEHPDREKRHKLENELAVVRAQRTKGIALCRSLK
ncbi:MAG: hypothetical protein H6981_08515 [Gammaproteobacteria bacterium]|nr:hypothetical protein [Gammaproteobacteria bacterium]MCP5136830.1 hypothetical protein [Gammaproteobacteria bacterium]